MAWGGADASASNDWYAAETDRSARISERPDPLRSRHRPREAKWQQWVVSRPGDDVRSLQDRRALGGRVPIRHRRAHQRL